MSKINLFPLYYLAIGTSLVFENTAQAWVPVDDDAENGAVSLAQYINDNPYGALAKIARISICFNSQNGSSACKKTTQGIDNNIFNATLGTVDFANSTAQFHLQAKRIFVFGNDKYTYSGDITIQSGFTINGCTYALAGSPTFTFANEDASNMPATYISIFHQQLTGQASEIMNTFLGGYQQLPGFLSSCK